MNIVCYHHQIVKTQKIYILHILCKSLESNCDGGLEGELEDDFVPAERSPAALPPRRVDVADVPVSGKLLNQNYSSIQYLANY